ncbi:MAG: hypothetical protein K0S33_2744 [Bacteroidetes bacterium]|jgi:hypothetical protein|nr:hypothetical protein [Bacteroidota bacterium]
MKLRFTILLVLSASFSLWAQSPKKISLCTDDKTSKHGFSFWSDVKVQSKDTSFYYLLHSQKKDIIEVLKPGEYTLTFNSVFGDKVRKNISIGSKKKYKLKVKGLRAAYAEVPTTLSFMDKLKTNDTVFIISSGLESINYEKIAITRLADGRYKSLQYQGLTDDVFNEYTQGEKTYLQASTYEKAVKTLPASTCIPHIITFSYKKQYYSLLDKSCPENTITRIKALMFLVEGGGK